MNEHEAMGRALELAWRGWGRVAPNPLVGAVLLAADSLVAEGWHAGFGAPHAEAMALRAAGSRAHGATLCVTLEPCTHAGKQPACTAALRAAGVSRVVAATRDPNPEAAGGVAELRDAGIAVEVGLRGSEAESQNAMFLHRWRETGRPFVALKLATSLDGRIADSLGHSRWLAGEVAREYVHWLRAGYDAIGLGGRSARVDDAALTVRGSLTPRRPPTRVIFDRRGDLPASLRLVRTAAEIPTMLVTEARLPVERAELLEQAGIRVVRALSLAAGLRALAQEGVSSLLIEGGGRLAGALLAAGLVDRYYWIQAPLWLGTEGTPALAALPGSPLDDAARWRAVERRTLGSDTLLVLDR
jgi:diaminohydroxyphosphoribosylaminopyrimidine deaminase / 5-amino-6-(5-phosphoribosylamino)uracil reductase